MAIRRLRQAPVDNDRVLMEFYERVTVFRRFHDAFKGNVRDVIAHAVRAFVQMPRKIRFNARVSIQNLE